MISWLNSHMPLKDRIQEIVDAGFKRSALARAAKKTPSAVTQWLSGETQEIKSDSAAGIQALTGFSAVWIATGRLPKKVIAQQVQSPSDGLTASVVDAKPVQPIKIGELSPMAIGLAVLFDSAPPEIQDRISAAVLLIRQGREPSQPAKTEATPDRKTEKE